MITEDDVQVSLKDVLIFFSGANAVPPLGFPRPPSLHFIHGPSPLPTASTCSLELHLPTIHSNYAAFKEAMITGIMGHGGFGMV